MQIANPLPIGRAPSAPSAGDTAPAEAAGGTSFAKLLNQQQPRGTSRDDTGDTGDAPCSDAQNDAQAAQTAETAHPRGERVRAPGRPAARAAERSVAREADPKAEPGPVDASRRDEPGTDRAPDPALQDWMAALNLPSHVAPTPGSGAAAGAVAASAPALRDAAAIDAGAQAAQPLAPIADGAAPRQAPGGPRAAGPDKSSAFAQGVPSGPTAPAGLEPAAANPAQAESARVSIDALAGVLNSPADSPTLPAAAHPLTGAPDRSAAPAVSVPIAMPIDAAQFPRAFGVQVSVLARDGVQRAELHLNPAEMGPVSVQIVMEGTQARIDFGADAAGTRQLIEHSLPELAAALREAGLTLTGGGVSQHSSGRGDGAGTAPHSRHGESAPATHPAGTPARPLRRNVRVGGIDLYA